MTIPELLIALAIAVPVTAWGLSGLVQLLDEQRGLSALRQMVDAIHLTRRAAIDHGQAAVLCPAALDKPGCGRRNRWHDGAIVFIDQDDDRRLDKDETLLARLPPLADGYRVYWRAFRNRTALVMNPSGMTDWQSGNMLFCPPDADARRAGMIIINAQGRVRTATDTDGDGIVEDAHGRPIACPP